MKRAIASVKLSVASLFCIGAAALLRHRRTTTVGARSRRVWVIGAYGNGNHGDDSIGISMSGTLRRASFDVMIGARASRIEWLEGSATPHILVLGTGLRGALTSWRIGRTATTTVLGGGSLLVGKHDSNGILITGIPYLLNFVMAGLAGSRLVVHGIDVPAVPYPNRIAARAVRDVLRAAESVAVRDALSQRVLEGYGVKATLVRDPASVLFAEWALERVHSDSIGVVLLDQYRWPTFSRGSDSLEAQRANDLNKVAEEVLRDRLPSDHIRLFSFHWSDTGIVNDFSQLLLARGVAEADITRVPYMLSPQRVFVALMSCRVVHSMRFHPALAALISGCEVRTHNSVQKIDEIVRFGRDAEGHWAYPQDFHDPEVVLLAACCD